jgi:hypothetical protein
MTERTALRTAFWCIVGPDSKVVSNALAASPESAWEHAAKELGLHPDEMFRRGYSANVFRVDEAEAWVVSEREAT